MKRLAGLVGVLSLSLLLLAPSAQATSGACSYHGGVNCAAGPGTYGQAICNDGWTGSSVSYSSMVMCSGYSTQPSCPILSSYDSLSGGCKCNYGYVTSTDVLGNQSCVSGYSKCTSQMGSGAQYDSISNTCSCGYGYVQSGGKCVSQITYCTNVLGLMSQYNVLSKQCECMSGYEYNGASCVYKSTSSSYAPVYSSSCPSNSTQSLTDSTKCQCNAGYQTNLTKDACVAIPAQTTSGVSSNGLTTAQIDAIIALLRSFGADASVIANVETSLGR